MKYYEISMNLNNLKVIITCRVKQQLTCCKYLVTARKSSSSTKKVDKSSTCDLVGQPNPVSNLRRIKFHVPDNECEIEREFRLKREEVQNWNEEFWMKHNSNFQKERKEFIASHEKETTSSDGVKEAMSADKLSVFYKRFLDKNWNTHLSYNYEWYKKNALLIILALRVKLNRLKQLSLHHFNRKSNGSNRLT